MNTKRYAALMIILLTMMTGQRSTKVNAFPKSRIVTNNDKNKTENNTKTTEEYKKWEYIEKTNKGKSKTQTIKENINERESKGKQQKSSAQTKESSEAPTSSQASQSPAVTDTAAPAVQTTDSSSTSESTEAPTSSQASQSPAVTDTAAPAVQPPDFYSASRISLPRIVVSDSFSSSVNNAVISSFPDLNRSSSDYPSTFLLFGASSDVGIPLGSSAYFSRYPFFIIFFSLFFNLLLF